jgi:phage-related minor tail protein
VISLLCKSLKAKVSKVFLKGAFQLHVKLILSSIGGLFGGEQLEQYAK